MTVMRRAVPATNDEFRVALYAGDIFLLPAVEASLWIAERARELLEVELGADMRLAQNAVTDEEFFAAVGKIRRVLYMEPEHHDAARRLMASLGFEPGDHAFDPIRLRTVMHEGHLRKRAAPVYYAHRDTWYANPQAMITWWIPLHDLAEEETFEFFPEYLRTPVKNGSAGFDYDTWTRQGWDLKIGWQDPKSGATVFYPQLEEEIRPSERLRFSCRAGEILLFAGAHLHQTLPQESGRTRFSLDFRAVHLRDHGAGIGAPNVDNRSTGSALKDYVRP